MHLDVSTVEIPVGTVGGVFVGTLGGPIHAEKCGFGRIFLHTLVSIFLSTCVGEIVGQTSILPALCLPN